MLRILFSENVEARPTSGLPEPLEGREFPQSKPAAHRASTRSEELPAS
jgi:hypothetical protein